MTRLAVALAAATLLRLIVAATVPLAPDESYYWIWSHALATGYLDAPPMVALWIRAGTILMGQTAIGVRLFGPLAAALASWMLFDSGRVLFPGTNAGLVAVLLLNASLLLGVGTVIMTPDSPLLFCWTATLWAMARLAAGGSPLWWLAAGMAGGLALDSKYTALFIWIGVALWVLLVPAMRPWLRRWHPWAACALGLALFTPVIVWNAEHNWVGFVKQGGRVEDWRPARAVGFLTELVGGQIGLMTPLVWLLCMGGLAVAVRHAWRSGDPNWSLLVALSLPPVMVFLQHAIGDRVQGNWPAIIYPALSVAAGGMASGARGQVMGAGPPMRRRWWIGASVLGFTITGLVYVQAITGLIPLPPRLDPIALRLAGWNELAAEVETSRRITDAAFVTADGYAVASELAWWMPRNVSIIGTGARWRLLPLPRTGLEGTVGLLVQDGDRDAGPDPALWEQAERVGTANRTGSGTGAFVVYRVVPRAGAEGIALVRR